jgi:DnaD/phage-associated family protein
MRLIWNYGTDVLTLPATLAAHVDKATKKDLRVLLALAADPRARIDLDAAIAAVAKGLSLSDAEIAASLSFWRGTGILLADEGEESTSKQAPAPMQELAPAQESTSVRVVTERGLPVYSSEELAGVLERRVELGALVDECQRAFDKIFNMSEVGMIAGLVDHLGLSAEYILLLLTHCRRMEKKSLRYAEKMAISLHDEGVDSAEELEARLHRIEVMATAVGKIRAMFGLSSRSLTTKEKGMIENWVCTMQYADAVLQKAYEITVDTINKPSIPYANTILERWYSEGYRTLEDVEKAIAEYRRKKDEGKSSFDVDDFFEAALKRTYGQS